MPRTVKVAVVGLGSIGQAVMVGRFVFAQGTTGKIEASSAGPEVPRSVSQASSDALGSRQSS